jgi:uncharacterized protein YjbI with pentapeptide repeats
MRSYAGLALSVALLAGCSAPTPTISAAIPDCGAAPAPGVDWSGCDLTGVKLLRAHLEGANLTAANLTNADLVGVNLSANLYRADLTGAIGMPADIALTYWFKAICPDRTTADDPPYTCQGHFLP